MLHPGGTLSGDACLPARARMRQEWDHSGFPNSALAGMIFAATLLSGKGREVKARGSGGQLPFSHSPFRPTSKAVEAR